MRFLRSLLLLVSAAAVMTACGSAPPKPPGGDPDLKQIQGAWRLDMGRKGHVLKQITGNQEVVSHYDRKGKLTAQHTATIGVRRIHQEPPVRVFFFGELSIACSPHTSINQ